MKFTQSIAKPTSDALFRVWGVWIETCLAAAGWVKETTPTGQIDWTTVSKPAASHTVAGITYWRMGDTLQATAPVFMKLEYGTGADAVCFALTSTFGAAVDAAGLTGLTSPTYRTGQGIQGSASTWLISADSNRLLIAGGGIAEAVAQSAMLLSVERTHDAAGVDTALGLIWIGNGGSDGTYFNNTTWYSYYWPWAGTSPGTNTLGPPVQYPDYGTGTDGVDTSVYPLLISKGGPWLHPPRNVLGSFAGNYSLYQTVDVPIYGAPVRYTRPDPDQNWASFYYRVQPASGNAVLPLLRFD